ncbi:MAG: Maf family protein [Verrucomicrobiota bacterium]
MPKRGPVPRRVVLASASPRRRDLLEAAGFEVIVRPAGVEELSEGLAPRALVIANAEMKALELATTTSGDVVLGADTVVVLDGQILGKPRDLKDATRMLRLLAGRTHEVLTGVCMLRGGTVVRCSFVESTLVAFRPFDEAMIVDYLKDINPLDKAGSYAAQEDRGRLIERIEGSMDNVIGLPVARVIEALEQHFAEPQAG